MDANALCLALENGMTVLTPNRRLAAAWQQHYAAYQASQSKIVFKTPSILPYTTWLNTLYEQAILQNPKDAPFRLSKIMSQVLWEREVQSTLDQTPVLQPAKTAQLLQAAYGLCQQWLIPLDDPRLRQAPEDEPVHTWMTHFEAQCEEHHWLDATALPQWVIQRLPSLKNQLPTAIGLLGFTQLTPEHHSLCEALNALGISTQTLTLDAKMGDCFQSASPNETTEWLTAARFAKASRDAHPGARIGVVVPDLESTRDRVIHAFKQVFNADEFNISAGKRLPDYPIIQAALNFLALYHGQLSQEEITHCLNSPFWGDAENEQVGRARLDAIRREHNVSQFHLKNLTRVQEGWFQQTCPRLFQRLQAFYAHLAPLKKQTMGEWASTMNQLLSILGWPGERILNSDEYQVVQAWLNVLTDASTLTPIVGKVSLSEALVMLRLAAHQSVFQPQSPEAPIQVLGLLEASGLSFDVLWVTGLDNLTWPPSPKPNPLLPKRLQRALAMPHATAERELAYCQTMMTQFKQSAARVYFSYAKERELSPREPSALLKSIPEIDLSTLPLAPLKTALQPAEENPLIEFLDEIAPAQEGTKCLGGVHAIKLQALCPFRAYAECRLDAKPLAEPQPGLLPKDRGILLHSALESVWQRLQSHAHLLSLTKEALDEVIASAIELAMNSMHLPFSKTSKYLQLEQQRLHDLIHDWLTLEKSRPPFDVVTHEKSVSVVLNEVTLAARIDRIDALEDGKHLIIDYKTGTRDHVSAWFDDRPEQPQLPLYTLVHPEKTTGIAFAQVNPKACVFKGLSETDTGIPGIKPSAHWSQELAAWRTILTALATAYQQGEAAVDPKDLRTTCEHCSLSGFCRIKESGVAYDA